METNIKIIQWNCRSIKNIPDIVKEIEGENYLGPTRKTFTIKRLVQTC